MAITYETSATALRARDLEGFFDGWPSPPSPDTHLRVLRGSYRVVIARDDSSGHVVGFANAVSDGFLAAYIPLLEVRRAFRGRGIGSELVRRLLDALQGLYMVDLVCDEALAGFYERLGFERGRAMIRRDFAVQSGRQAPG